MTKLDGGIALTKSNKQVGATVNMMKASKDMFDALDEAIQMVHNKSGMDQAVVRRMYAALNKAKGE